MRYLRILSCCWKNSLIREMGFRTHFVLNVVSELGWVGMMLVFVEVIYANTRHIRGWDEHQYLFLLGTHMILASVFEAFLFGNCWRFSELIRKGDLDFLLLRPVSTQFLVSIERVNYSALANLPVGVGICIYAAVQANIEVTPVRLALFIVLIGAGLTTLYALLFMFAVTSIWLIRQTGLEHLWFYTVSLARYPAEIYRPFAGGVMWFILVFIFPVLLVANLPAGVIIRTFNPMMVGYSCGVAVVLAALSALMFRLALRWYRSASS